MAHLTLSMNIAASFKFHTSEIDWCETNYQISDYIVEYWNTISNIPTLLLAIYSYWSWQKTNGNGPFLTNLMTHFGLLHLIFILIPIFSTYFHASLSYMGQVTDELSILVFVILIEPVFMTKCYKVLLSLVVLMLSPSSNRILLAVYGFISVWTFSTELENFIHVKPMSDLPEETNSNDLEIGASGTSFACNSGEARNQRDFYECKRYFQTTMYLSGIATLFWIIDIVFCDYLVMSLHWIWHLLSGLALFYAIKFLLLRDLIKKSYNFKMLN